MPFANIDGSSIYYRLDSGFDKDDRRPVLVFGHSLGLDHGQWDLQVADLIADFRVLRYDLRGHGASNVAPGDYSIAQLGRDVLGIMNSLGIDKFAFCGLSIGGMIGQWLAANAPTCVTHAILANTTSGFADSAPMKARIAKVLEGGIAAIEEMVMQRFFTPESLAKNDPHVRCARFTLLTTSPVGYAGCAAAIANMQQRHLLSQITVPTLVISGERDASTPWTGNGEVLASSIRGAKVVHLPTAHISNIEMPDVFNTAVREFLMSAVSGAAS